MDNYNQPERRVCPKCRGTKHEDYIHPHTKKYISAICTMCNGTGEKPSEPVCKMLP